VEHLERPDAELVERQVARSGPTSDSSTSVTGRWRKALTWAGAVAYVYIGSHLPLWGVNVQALLDFENRGPSTGGLLGLYELVFQGGLHRAAILALGIMPYLTARVFLWMWRRVRPSSTTAKTTTRILTAALSVIQSIGFATFLERTPGVVANPGAGFMTTTVLTVTAAALVAMWFAEKLTESDDPDDIDDDSVLRGEITSGNFAHANESRASRPRTHGIPR
jgi:preprotein translocase subunit SecY